jgi:Arc/MetJ-type ribon-helix-helix transcriptional regulator
MRQQQASAVLVLIYWQLGITLFGVTITLKIPEATARWLEEQAKQRHRSKSELVREAIEQLRKASRPKSALTVAGDAVGRVASGKRDLASNKAHLRRFGR